MSTISRKKKTALLVYVTRDQHRQIKREAKAYAVTLSDLVRYRLGIALLPGQRPTPPPIPVAPEAKP